MKKKLIKNLFIVLFLVFILDYIIGSILETYYFKITSGNKAKITYVIDKMKDQIVIIGASNATHHHIPEIYERKLNTTCYNAGQDGMGLLYYNSILNAILNRYKPKLIVLDLSPYAIDNRSLDLNRMSILLPYYNNHSEIHSFILQRSKFEKYKLWSKIYPYNSMTLNIIWHSILSKKNNYISENNGYKPLNGVLHLNDVEDQKDWEIIIDMEKIKLFQEFIQTTKNYNVDLIIIIPPYFSTTEGQVEAVNLIKKICKKDSIKCLDYSDSSFFENNPQLFHNISHLNSKGAIIFTEDVIDDILVYYKNKLIFNN